MGVDLLQDEVAELLWVDCRLRCAASSWAGALQRDVSMTSITPKRRNLEAEFALHPRGLLHRHVLQLSAVHALVDLESVVLADRGLAGDWLEGLRVEQVRPGRLFDDSAPSQQHLYEADDVEELKVHRFSVALLLTLIARRPGARASSTAE